MKIDIKHVSKSYKNNLVLDNVNIIFEGGKIYGLNGRNGSGKTVFLKLLCGLISPTKGEIFINDKQLLCNNNYEFNIGALIENPKFFPSLTGYQNLDVLAKIKNEIGEEEIMNVLEIVNLTEEKDKKYSKYSLGMKQKLGIAQAIMENQSIILLDEPFSGIEETSVQKIKKYLLSEKEKGKIIIISSHIKEDLTKMCDKIILVSDGFLHE